MTLILIQQNDVRQIGSISTIIIICIMKKLIYSLIKDPNQVEAMRLIYNDNLDMLATRPLPRREYQEQQDWWSENKSQLQAYLFEIGENPGKPMAFLVLRNRGGFYTPIIAIEKSHWGKGFGREIIKEYINLAKGPLAGSQLRSNKSICHLNQQSGWIVIGERQEQNSMVELLFHPGSDPKPLDNNTISGIAQYLELPVSDVILKISGYVVHETTH